MDRSAAVCPARIRCLAATYCAYDSCQSRWLGRQPVTTATCGMRHVAGQMPQLETAQLQHDPVVAADLRELLQQAAADVAAEPCPRGRGPQDGRRHGRRGRFAVGAGHADHPRRARPQKKADFGLDFLAGPSGQFEEAVSGPHRRIDDDQVGVLKVFFPMAAQVKLGDRRAGQGRQRVGQRRRVGRIGHGDSATCPASQRAAATPPPKCPKPMTVTRRL